MDDLDISRESEDDDRVQTRVYCNGNNLLYGAEICLMS